MGAISRFIVELEDDLNWNVQSSRKVQELPLLTLFIIRDQLNATNNADQ